MAGSNVMGTIEIGDDLLAAIGANDQVSEVQAKQDGYQSVCDLTSGIARRTGCGTEGIKGRLLKAYREGKLERVRVGREFWYRTTRKAGK